MKIQLQNMLFYPSTGGIETILFNVGKVLLRLGHEPIIFCVKHQKELRDDELYEGIKIIRHPRPYLPFPFTIFNPIYYVKKIQRQLTEFTEDVNAIWGWHPYYCYASGKVFKGKKPLIYCQAFPFPRFLRRNFEKAGFAQQAYINFVIPQARMIERKAIEMSDKISVVSRSEQREISDFYGLPLNRFVVIPPGVDLQKFKPRIKDENLLRELGLTSYSKIILTAGRLTSQKNVETLIRTFSMIDCKDLYLIIVGDGWQRPHLEKLAFSLRQRDRIKFVGFRKDIERFFSIADIFVLPSKYEGFGIVFLEAMASGVPCVGLKSDYPNVIVASDEIIEEGETGYCAQPYSIDDLADKIKRLIFNEPLRIKMGKRAHAVCEERYSWERHVNSLLNLTLNI